MNEKLNKNAKFEQLTKMFLSSGEEKGLIVKDPLSRPQNKTFILGASPAISYMLSDENAIGR